MKRVLTPAVAIALLVAAAAPGGGQPPPGDGMEGDRSINIFLTQVIENFNMERPMMPLIGFVEVDGDLDRHRVWHFTAPAPAPCPRAPLRGTADCC